MARARLIKPGFFANEALAEFGPWVRLLFAGLWTLADREGRIEDRPRRIKGALFPYDDVDVEEGLASLAAGGFIVRYSADGERYIEVSAFRKHQSPHVREPASMIPAPCSPDARPAFSGTGPAVTGNRYTETVTGDLVLPEPADAVPPEPTPLATAKRITDDFRAEMRLAFPDLDEAAEFDKATNHIAYRKAIDKRRYYRNWLTNAQRYLDERRNGNGRRNQHGPGNALDEYAIVASTPLRR